jgi:transcriptional regulator with XRE-family HTH domain
MVLRLILMIGERLQELRKDNNISQAELAKVLGVSHYTISSYECNRSDPDDVTKIKIANLFNVSVDYLLGLIDEPFSFLRDNSTIIIPNNFDKSDIEDIKDYIAYLKYKKENTV